MATASQPLPSPPLPPSPPAAAADCVNLGAASEAAAARRAAALADLCALSPTQYAVACTAEAAAAAAVFLPFYFIFFAVDGALDARRPRPAAAGSPAAPVPLTYGGLLSTGLRAALPMSARTFFWLAAASGVAAAAREALQLGPRHEGVGRVKRSGPWAELANGAGGLAAGAVATAGLGMAPARRALYLGMSAGLGVALPGALAAASPAVRRQLQQTFGRGALQ